MVLKAFSHSWNEILGYGLSATILALAIVGGRLHNTAVIYAMLAFIILAVCLVAFDKLKERTHPYLVFAIGLGMLFQTTLISSYLVGTDIHSEFYYAWRTYEQGFWDTTIQHGYNSAMSITVLVPLLAGLFHTSIIWILKAVCPIFLAASVLVFYYLFKQYFDSKVAFLSAFVIVSIPTYILELSSIAKQEIGQLFFALCIFIIADSKLKYGWKVRIPLMALFLLAATLSHYSVGYILAIFIGLAVILLLGVRHILKGKVSMPLKHCTLVLVIVAIASGFYFANVSGGSIWRSTTNAFSGQVNSIERVFTGYYTQKTPQPTESLPSPAPPPPSDESSQPAAKPPVKVDIYLGHQEQLIKTAFGFDFAEVPIMGKVFRGLQFIVQILLVVGSIWLVKNWRRFKPEYLAVTVAGIIILGASAFVPGLSSIINASRFYFMALLVLAPLLVLSGKVVFRSYRVLTLVLLVPYFVFASGIMFESTQQKDVGSINVPYSYSLSGNRLDLTGVYSKDDCAVRDWIVDNNAVPVFSDLWGAYLLLEKMGDSSVDFLYFPPDYRTIPSTKEYASYTIESPVTDNGYIFLRGWNEEHQEVTDYAGIGQRHTRGYSEAGLDKLLEGREVIYQCGLAKVYGTK